MKKLDKLEVRHEYEAVCITDAVTILGDAWLIPLLVFVSGIILIIRSLSIQLKFYLPREGRDLDKGKI